MSQRTRIRTTGAAAPPPSEPSSGQGGARASSEPRRRAPAKRPDTSVAPAGQDDERSKGLGLGALGPEHLARALRAVASELERDPALARRVSAAVYAPGDLPARDPQTNQNTPSPAEALAEKPSRRKASAFTPRVVEGVSATLGTGILDPFAVRAALGEVGLRAALADLRLGSLRAIVREHQLDPEGSAVRGNDAERLRTLILERSATRAKG